MGGVASGPDQALLQFSHGGDGVSAKFAIVLHTLWDVVDVVAPRAVNVNHVQTTADRIYLSLP